jgi:hypothetical protein
MSPRQPVVERIDPQVAAILRHKTPAEKLEMAFGMWRFARDTIRRVVAMQHPDWTPEEVQRETARRLSHGDR